MNKVRKTNFVLNIPEEMLFEILQYLNVPEIVNLSILNKFWCSVCFGENLWKLIYQRTFFEPPITKKTYYDSFRNLYESYNEKNRSEPIRPSIITLIPKFKNEFTIKNVFGVESYQNNIYVYDREAIYSYNFRDRTLNWKFIDFLNGQQVNLNYSILSDLLIVYIYHNQFLFTINKKGELIWSFDFKLYTKYKFLLDGDVIMMNEKIYLLFYKEYEKSLYIQMDCISVKTGKLIKSEKIKTMKSWDLNCIQFEMYNKNIFIVKYRNIDLEYLQIIEKPNGFEFISGYSLNEYLGFNLHKKNVYYFSKYDNFHVLNCINDDNDNILVLALHEEHKKLLLFDKNFIFQKSFPTNFEFEKETCLGYHLTLDSLYVSYFFMTDQLYYMIVQEKQKYYLIGFLKDNFIPVFIEYLNFNDVSKVFIINVIFQSDKIIIYFKIYQDFNDVQILVMSGHICKDEDLERFKKESNLVKYKKENDNFDFKINIRIDKIK